MKKLLIFLIVLFSTLFIGIKNVYAESDFIYDYDSFNVTENELFALNKVKIFMEDNFSEYKYIIGMTYDREIAIRTFSVFSNDIGISCFKYSSENYIRLDLIKTSSTGRIYSTFSKYLVSDINDNILIKNNIYVPIKDYSLGSSNSDISNINQLVAFFKSNISNNSFYFEFLYYSNFEFNIVSNKPNNTTSKTLSVKYNDNYYDINVGDKFLFYYNLLNQPYFFNEIIDTTNIDKILFKFDIPDNLNIRDTFPFDLKYKMFGIFTDDYFLPDATLYTQSEYDIGDITQIDLYTTAYEQDGFSASIIENEENKYLGIYEYEYGIDYYPLNYLNLEININDYIGNFGIQFESNINFNVEYISKEVEEQHYTKINMNNIYGLYLIPNTINTDVYTTIYSNGIYDITYSTDYIEQESLDDLEGLHIIDFNLGSYSRLFRFNTLNNMLYYKNKNLNDKTSYIKFDNRIFNYSIQEKKEDNPEIFNPNTNSTDNTSNFNQLVNDLEIQILINENNGINSLFDIFKNNSNTNNNLFNKFNDVYKIVRKSKIGIYVYLVILTSIIILIIKSLKR